MYATSAVTFRQMWFSFCRRPSQVSPAGFGHNNIVACAVFSSIPDFYLGKKVPYLQKRIDMEKIWIESENSDLQSEIWVEFIIVSPKYAFVANSHYVKQFNPAVPILYDILLLYISS